MKKCSICKKEKPYTEFRKRCTTKDGYTPSCKQCDDTKYTKTCEYCEKEFKTGKKEARFCSRKCSSKTQENRVNTHCDVCNKEITLKESVYNKYKNHYCSVECKTKGNSQYKGKNNPQYKRVKIKCSCCGIEFEVVPSRLDNKKDIYCSLECKAKGYSNKYSKENHPMWGKHHTEETINRISSGHIGRFVGSKSGRFNPTLTDEQRIKNTSRHSDMKYIKWYKAVMRKYNYTCVICNKKGGDIVAHHLEGFNWCENLRYDVNNGVILCDNCHKDFHSKYGYGNNTNEQFEEYSKVIRVEG